VAVNSSGDVYIADIGSHRIQKYDSSGSFILKWGNQGSGDGQFNAPRNVVADISGDVYVADALNKRIQKFDSTGSFILKWGGPGTGEGQFNFPSGLAMDSSGNLYVADTANHRIQKFAPASAVMVSGTLSLQSVVSTTTFALIDANVVLAPTGGGSSTAATVASDGGFTIEDVQAGTYDVTASAPGFLVVLLQDLAVSGSSVVLIHAELRAGLVNGDTIVSIRDLSAVAASFGQVVADRTDGLGRIVDLNGDGVVNINDISAVASNFGASSPLPWPE
jgi:hypothetical protein